MNYSYWQKWIFFWKKLPMQFWRLCHGRRVCRFSSRLRDCMVGLPKILYNSVALRWRTRQINSDTWMWLFNIQDLLPLHLLVCILKNPCWHLWPFFKEGICRVLEKDPKVLLDLWHIKTIHLTFRYFSMRLVCMRG